MRSRWGIALFPAAVPALVLTLGVAGYAESGRPARALITQRIDARQVVALAGNTRPEASARNDLGLVAGNYPMDHMLLQLRRPPELEQALDSFLDGLSTPGSPNYHKWMTAEEFGQRFGPAQTDLDTTTGWLQSSGFTVNMVYSSGMVVDFSGTAAQVRKAFGTEIHRLSVDGVPHIANMSDPKIPAALAPVVVGIVALHDFKHHPTYKPRTEPAYTVSGSEHLVTPGDLATIYNLNPLFSQGVTGQGQTIVVIEDSDVYNAPDWTTFRTAFGLSSYATGSFTQIHPGCTDPLSNGDAGEATLDAEYASAAAPGAAIELASCSSLFTALLNVIGGASPPSIMSVSYGGCEAIEGAAANQAIYNAYQQAAGEGISVFASTGDEGAASCDANLANATHGVGVSALASTPYNVAVGGTDFGDSYTGTTSTYWNSANTATYASAKSYIPEIPWNDSCASVVLAAYKGYSLTYGSSGFCNSTAGASYLTTASGSGGPSGCATGTPSTSKVVSGTCAGWPKPSWQVVFGNPADGVRDLPDVSLFAANGVWGHYYVVCLTHGTSTCTGAPSTWAGFGGTSVSTPIMAGIQALVNQVWGKQGNPDPVYYKIAAAEYGSSGNSACNSSSLPQLRRGLASTCVFYDVTQGDMDVNCTGANNCYLPSGTYGVLSLSNSAYQPAYGTAVGWDFSTGIGTVNAYNLVHNANW